MNERAIQLEASTAVKSHCSLDRGGCGAEILWVEVKATRRNMPVDPEPNPKGNLEMDGVRYMPHWATCPNADRFKK